MPTLNWVILATILWISCFAGTVLVQKRHQLMHRFTARLLFKLILGGPIALLFVATFGLLVYLAGDLYLGTGTAVNTVQARIVQYTNRFLETGELLTLESVTQQEVDATTVPKESPTLDTSTTPSAIAQRTDLEQQQLITSTITPAVIFATATAAKQATETAAALPTDTPLAEPTSTPTSIFTSTSTPSSLSTPAFSEQPTESAAVASTLTPQPVAPAETSASTRQAKPTDGFTENATENSAPAAVTQTPSGPESMIDIADMPALTATAQEEAAQATVEAVLTRVDNPDFEFEAFTPTPTPIVITATPTPGDIFEAATAAAIKTVQAISSGTATATPENWKVVTPVYVVSTPTPENAATASYRSALATAQVVTTGTPDPYRYVVVVELITATPTATNLVAAAQTLAAATIQATTTGTPTPTPRNWQVVTPVVVTATATPANALTAEAQSMRATAAAVLTATPPWHMLVVTATATPPFVLIEDPIELLNLAHRSPAYPFPPQLLGKILFRSDVSGKEEIYAINPDGSGLAQLPDNRAYRLAEARDAYSFNGLDRAYALRDTHDRRIQIHYESFEYGTTRGWSAFGNGVSWAPAWSPSTDRIAFVSNSSGNDEIWVMDKDQWPAIQVTHNDWEWDKHPSWSPDGSTIVFASNRIEGNRQLWLMDADGSNQRQLTGFELPLNELGHLFSDLVFEAWDPVWVKYPDPYIRMSRESYLARPECIVCVPIDE